MAPFLLRVGRRGFCMTVTIEKGGPLAVPLDDLKRYLGISLDDEDDVLSDLIRTASEMAEGFLGRMVIVRSVTEMRGAGSGWQRLVMQPVQAIGAVEGVPADGAAFALPVEAYAVDIGADGAASVRVVTPGSAGRVRVTYTAGMASVTDDVPDAIQHAIIRMAGELHARREGLEGELPASVTALLRPWRRVRIV